MIKNIFNYSKSKQNIIIINTIIIIIIIIIITVYELH